ncbi:MAG: lipid-A-disaccharide synthase [Betaproteobacteria bacterium RIFCSPLOWO2_02_FULL_63_19]|nr:MAG: lipid-A-disaccharide synthase [Betaproteobacteria bacterium RIFCSPLOWO2_02_FULL_63_19]
MVAGEASGDFLGAHLINALKLRVPSARFVGIGGAKMKSTGFDAWFPIEKLAVRGYIEVLRHYSEIVSIRRRTRRRLLREKPAIFVGIDAPDFNLHLEASLKRSGIPTIHYVGPSVWAWRRARLRHIARAVDQMLVLFPFEAAIYKQAGIPVVYVGHPLADVIPLEDATSTAREQLQLSGGAPIFALLPGSRQSELRYMAATFVRTAKLVSGQLPGTRFLVPLINRETRSLFEAALHDEGCQDLPLTILFGHARDAIAAADAVLVASGTATLEAALLRTPMVVTYRMAPLTWKIMSRMRYQPYVSLPNIIAGEFIVPELLQDEASPENLSQALINVYNDPVVQRRLPQRLAAIHHSLRQDAATRAAEAVLPWLTA